MLRILHSLTVISVIVATAVSGRGGAATEAASLEQKREELFAALDLSFPGLGSVKAAVESGELSQAQTHFASYLRNRRIRTWEFDPHHVDRDARYNPETARNALVGRVVGGSVELWKQFPDNKINWLHNETRHNTAEAYNPEWQWQLNRMQFWNDLAGAYRATGDERYAQAWVAQFRSFIRQCSAPAGYSNGPDTAWRTLEAAIRMRNSWPNGFHSFLLSPAVTDEDLLLYAYSSLQHGRYLKAWPSSANWLITEMSGLYAVGVVFPEFKDSTDWRRHSIQKLHDEFTRQFLADGSHYEYSPGYHLVSLDHFLAIPRLAQVVDRLGELPADYIAAAQKGYDYLLYLTAPDYALPRLNDSWSPDIRRAMERALDFFPDRQDFRWIATGSRQGGQPLQTSRAFLNAGYFVMRSGWESDANYAVFDGGLPGYGHQHQDKLNLVIWAFGRELLFDNGGGAYEQSKWRAYSVDTFSHNTILVDGKGQRRPYRPEESCVSRSPVDARWNSTETYDFVAATYDQGYGTETSRPATHTRRILFIKPDIFVVADTLVPNDSLLHSYQARWHLIPTQTHFDKTSQTVTTTADKQANLSIIPLRSADIKVEVIVGQTVPEILGWNIRSVGPREERQTPASTVLHTRSGTGTQSFFTLLLPIRPNQTSLLLSVQSTGPNTFLLILKDGRRVTLEANPDPTQQLAFTCERGAGA